MDSDSTKPSRARNLIEVWLRHVRGTRPAGNQWRSMSPMSRQRSHLMRALVSFVALLTTASACTGPANESRDESTRPVTSKAQNSSDPDGQMGCTLTPLLVPSCGTLWGVTTPTGTAADLKDVERSVGRRFDFVYTFHDINDVVPTPEERAAVSNGTLLHITIDSRDYSTRDRTAVTWSDVANGRYDESLRGQARGIASLRKPVFMTFSHEPDQTANEAMGTPTQFQDAWRHVHEVFAEEGATNAVWVWVIMGWAPALPRAATMWPGNKYVDWISWEVYNKSGCTRDATSVSQYQSFGELARIGYTWVHQTGPKIGMDVNKPMMISETGSVQYPEDPELTANWYSEIPAALKDLPQIKAIGLWDHDGTGQACDYQFTENPAVLKAIVKARQTSPLDTATLSQ